MLWLLAKPRNVTAGDFIMPKKSISLRQLLGWQRAQLLELVRHRLLVEGDDLIGVLNCASAFFAASWVELELAVDDDCEEPDVGDRRCGCASSQAVRDFASGL